MKLRDFEIDAFREFIARRGGVEVPPRDGEAYAFEHDGIRGGVHSRKDGHFSMNGLARVYCGAFEIERAADPARKVSAPAVHLRLFADECDLAIAMLADEGRATVYIKGDGSREGLGGWGVHINAGFTTIDICGGALATSRARMEISAALIGLKVTPAGSRVKVIADAPLLRRGMHLLDQWALSGWVDAGAERPVYNADLWAPLHAAIHRRDVAFKWITPETANFDLKNRAADLARAGMQSVKQWENVRCSTK